eukprot:IDg11704t1
MPHDPKFDAQQFQLERESEVQIKWGDVAVSGAEYADSLFPYCTQFMTAAHCRPGALRPRDKLSRRENSYFAHAMFMDVTGNGPLALRSLVFSARKDGDCVGGAGTVLSSAAF